MATPTITAADLAAPLALDADIAALCDAAPGTASPFNWTALTAATGCTRAMYFANFTALRTQLDIDAAATARDFIAEQAVIAEATSCGYIATRKSTRAARHGGFESGAVRQPARALVNDAAGQKARARAWGHAC